MTMLQALAVGVLVLASWPLVRFLSIPTIRRAYSRLAAAALAMLAAWYGLVAISFFVAPSLLTAVAGIAFCLMAAERWRARNRYGVAAGLPPGTLSVVPRGPWVDEKFYAKQAAQHGPVFKMSQFLRPMVCVMGPSEGADLLEHHAAALYSPPVRFSRFIPRGYIRYMAPADHSIYRPLFRAALSTRVLNECRADFQRLIDTSLGDMMRTSQSSATGIHPEPFLSDLAFRCTLRLFLGIGQQSPDLPRLLALYRDVEIGKASSRWRPVDREAVGAIAAFIEERLTADDELPSCVVSEFAGSALPHSRDRTALLNVVYMTRISGSDLGGFLTWSVKILLDNQEWFDRLQALVTTDSEDQAAELAGLMLREMLRLERSEFIFRKARADIEYKGHRIPRDWIVRICIRDGHRDPGTFPQPDAFDPMRFKGKAYSKRAYSPLGIGAHACLGGQTVYVVGTIFLLALARTCRAKILSDAGREYGRSHWQPASSWRIALMPLVDEARGCAATTLLERKLREEASGVRTTGGRNAS